MFHVIVIFAFIYCGLDLVLLAAARIVCQIQTLRAKRFSPSVPSVLSVPSPSKCQREASHAN